MWKRKQIFDAGDEWPVNDYYGLGTIEFPNPMYIKNFVDGDSRCNYEIYVRELLNASPYFQTLSKGERYIESPTESKGECDAISEAYSIDFKLFEAASFVEGKRKLSLSISQMAEGVTLYGPPECKGHTLVVELGNLIGQIKSVEELSEIYECRFRKGISMFKREDGNMDNQISYEVGLYVQNLRKEKNLLWLIPRMFVFRDKEVYFEKGVKIIEKAITDTFLVSCEYRKKEGLGRFDTFVALVFMEKMIFLKYTDGAFLLVDAVDLSASKTFDDMYLQYKKIF